MAHLEIRTIKKSKLRKVATGHDIEVFLDGVKVPLCRAVDLKIEAGKVVTATLTIYPTEVTVDTEPLLKKEEVLKPFLGAPKSIGKEVIWESSSGVASQMKKKMQEKQEKSEWGPGVVKETQPLQLPESETLYSQVLNRVGELESGKG